VLRFRSFLLQPLNDYVGALGVVIRPGERRLFLITAAALVLSWWVYVPVHELAHAFGCIATGGTVSRLEIAPVYGAAWLQGFFPFIVSGSDYAGRLSGFDTHGSDWVYLATDAAPFVLTVVAGVPLLRSVRARSTLSGRVAESAKFGFALPIAFAPFISLTGDYYEMGSIVVSRSALWWDPSVDLDRWRSDDVLRLLTDLSAAEGGIRPRDAAAVAVGLVLGGALAWGTYALGTLWTDVLRRMRRRTPGPA
jgi:hypothetical protein